MKKYSYFVSVDFDVDTVLKGSTWVVVGMPKKIKSAEDVTFLQEKILEHWKDDANITDGRKTATGVQIKNFQLL